MIFKIVFFLIVTLCFFHLLYLIVVDFQHPNVINPSSSFHPFVSIIVPTLNEAQNLPQCLESLLNLNYPNKEILVVDGGSSDNTRQIALQYEVQLLTYEHLPKDWVGKSYACHLGYQASKGEVLLFTDADTVHAPESLNITITKLFAENVTLLSMIPYQKAEKWYEFLSGYYFFLAWLIRGSKKNLLNKEKKDFFAIGQYMLFQREKYESIGGHKAIYRNVVEDLALAKLVKEKKQRLTYIENQQLVSCRMYPDGFKSFYDGFRKSIWTGIEIVPIPKCIMAGLWIAFGLLTPVFLLNSIFIVKELSLSILFGGCYLLFCFALFYEWHSHRQDHPMVYLLYPIGFLITTIILFTSIYDGIMGKPVLWKGIKYHSKKKGNLQTTPIPINTTNSNRLAALDFLRGVAILLVIGFHSIERALPSNYWDQFLTSSPRWQFYLFGPFLLLMSWRGFFILISAIVYIYTYETKSRIFNQPGTIWKNNMLKGGVLFIFGCVINVFLDPFATVGYLINTGQWRPDRFIERLKFSDAVQMIVLGLMIYSTIHFFLMRGGGVKKPSRNMLIYGALAIVVIFFTPVVNNLVFSRYGVQRDEILGMHTPTLLSFVEGMLVANIVGYAQPLFPYLAVTFVGCIIGIIISQSEWSNREKLKTLYFLGSFILIFGLFDWIVLTGMEPMTTFMIAPRWFLIVNSGLQTLLIGVILQVLDYPKSHEKHSKRIRKVRAIRRAGLLSLTLFATQFLDILPRLLLTKITGIDFKNYGQLHTIYEGFLLLSVVILFWILVLRLWEIARFYGSFDWMLIRVIGFISKRKYVRKDPLHINKNLYAIERESSHEEWKKKNTQGTSTITLIKPHIKK